MHYYAEIETEMDRLRIAYSPHGITMIALADGNGAAFEKAYRKLFGTHATSRP
jgi:hypothetical protein